MCSFQLQEVQLAILLLPQQKFADSIPKDQLVPSKQKSVPSQSSKQRSTASVAASKTWITATRGSATVQVPVETKNEASLKP